MVNSIDAPRFFISSTAALVCCQLTRGIFLMESGGQKAVRAQCVNRHIVLMPSFKCSTCSRLGALYCLCKSSLAIRHTLLRKNVIGKNTNFQLDFPYGVLRDKHL
jgi:hypothetical protein